MAFEGGEGNITVKFLFRLREQLVAGMKKRVAILGGGAGAQTMAADFALAGGYEVRLCEVPEIASRTLGEVLETRKIELTGVQSNWREIKRVGVAELDIVTTDIAEALDEAELIEVAIPAIGHKTFFEKMIPRLEDGQVISIHPDNFGSLLLRKMMQDKGCNAKVVIGGWNTLPYGTRVIKPGKVNCMIRACRIRYDTLPSKDGDIFLKAVKDVPPLSSILNIDKGDTVLDIGLSNPNPLVHVPGSILNVGAMEVAENEDVFEMPKGSWSLYKHGRSPAVARVEYAYYQELCRIADRLGIEIMRYPKGEFFDKSSIMRSLFDCPFYTSSPVMGITGPHSVEDRYFTEDVPFGTVMHYNLARKVGVEVPLIETLIRLASVICGRDFFKEGRALKECGLDGLSLDKMMKYLREGRL